MELFYFTGAYTCYMGMLGKPQKGMWKVVSPTLAANGLSLFYTYCFGDVYLNWIKLFFHLSGWTIDLLF